MGGNRKIIIEKGGKLVVDDGIITRLCDSYWQGIEVIGDRTLAQTAANQGTLELKNGAIIEYANNAIVTGLNGDASKGGGIIYADNTTFRNNRRSVEFLQYTQSDNLSYFTNCTFELTSTYPQSTYVGMVTIWDNYGIPFTTCTFRNQSTAVTNKQYGIYTIDAGYQVLTGCTFDGFTGGVYSTNSSTTRTFSVSVATFSNNALGVYAGSVNNVSATISTFNVGQYRTSSYNHGVFINNSTGYTVEGNSFTGYLPTLAPVPVGVLCWNTGDANNQIKGNSYTNLYIGNHAFGDNRNNSIPSNGLKYFCNTNTNNANYDFRVTIDDNIIEDDSGIATPQGSSGAAAGNKFSLRSTPSGSDFYNGTIHSIQYYYRNASSENPGNLSGVTKTLTAGNPTCTAPMLAGGGSGSLSLTELNNLQNDYITQRAKYDTELQTRKSKLDKGDTKALLMEIENVQRGNSTALEEKLLGISPWLSAEVLKKVLDKKDAFQENFATKILEANPDALYSPSLQVKMQETLTTTQLSAVRATQTIITERTALEGRLSDAGTAMDYNANAIIRHYIITEPIDLKKVREWLYNKNDIQSRYQIAESWLQEKSTVQAQKAVNEIGTELELTERQKAVYEDYQKLTDLKIKAMDEGRTIADFNESEVAKLVELADRNLGRAGEQARGILNFFYGYQYVAEQLLLNEDVNIRESNLLPPSVSQNPSETNTPVSAYPNPVSNEVTFQFDWMQIELKKAFIQITDFTGRIIERLPIVSTSETIRWDMSAARQGIYSYQLIDSGV
ncbi:MAG: T9SS type A sorting domain-containing protein [Saprospiraceae bacterium]|nr:T9SS type A sorting domain-containing protein [Saprospiraceae bacterium]